MKCAQSDPQSRQPVKASLADRVIRVPTFTHVSTFHPTSCALGTSSSSCQTSRGLNPLAQMIRGPAALPRGPGLCQKAVCTRNHNPKGG